MVDNRKKSPFPEWRQSVNREIMPKELNHIRAWIEKICGNLDLTLIDFLSDAEVEFSYQIKIKDEYAGFVYKKRNKPL